MTWTAWRTYFVEFVQAIRTAFPDKQIVHNSVWYAGNGVGRDTDPHILAQNMAAGQSFGCLVVAHFVVKTSSIWSEALLVLVVVRILIQRPARETITRCLTSYVLALSFCVPTVCSLSWC